MNDLRKFIRTLCRATVVVLAAFGVWTLQCWASDAPSSEWIHADGSGKLVYKKTAAGDRIVDFSHAGYMGGGVALPDVPVKRTVEPTGGDSAGDSIQAAIDAVAALPLEGGFRGTVLLGPGTFACAKPITISASGIVLRGSGATGENKTTMKLIGNPHLGIQIRSDARARVQANGAAEALGSAQSKLTQSYVPCGATEFTVTDSTGFAAGDTIEIRRPVTEAWVKFMHMDNLVRDGKPQTWVRVGNFTVMRRQIIGIAGKMISVDIPLTDSFDAGYLDPPGTAVVKVPAGGLPAQVGVEHLHIEAPPQEINHTQAHFTAVRMNGEDCWMRDVVCDDTMNSIGISGRRITLQRVVVNRVARHQGSSKPAEFAPNASQLLLDRCSGSGDNIWYAGVGSQVTGPIVMLNCTFSGNGRIESHQRWSTAMLYDNCRVPDGGIDFRNRGAMGSGHGWSMGWGVAWNCEAKDFVIQSPPGAANWMIGCIGTSKLMPRPFDSTPPLPEGIKDAHGTPVTPRSLYLAQLAERLGPQALKNIGY